MWGPDQVEASWEDFLEEVEDREALQLATLEWEKAHFWL